MLKLRWQLFAFLLGSTIFFWVLSNFGFASVAAVLAGAGKASSLIFLFYSLMCLPDVAAWKFSFSGELSHRVRFWRLYFIRLAGEAINNITPFIDIGGEPLKAHLSQRYFGIPAAGAVSSTVVARTSLLISEAVFLLIGVALSFILIPMGSRYRAALVGACSGVCFIFILFLFLQQRGWLKKINPEIARYYADHSERFWTAVPLNTLGWILGGIETYLFCRILGVDISVLEAVMLEALLQLIRTGSFFIPGNLGVQEGGLAFLIGQMGFQPVLGVGLSLLKRFRQIVWTGLGFLVWAYYQYQEAKKKDVLLRDGGLLSFDTWLDRRIHRPLAEAAAAVLSKTPVTPDQVTVCTVVPAVLSASFFAVGSFSSALIGVFFFYLWSVADHVDGSLARRKQLFSKYGRLLDDSFDNLASTLVFLGIFLGFIRLWNAGDRSRISVIFYLALAVNVLSQAFATFAKRRSRNRAVEDRKTSQGFLWKQKMLDFFTARDGVYFFMALVLCAHFWGPQCWSWYSFVMGFLIISMVIVSAISTYEFLRQR